MGGRQGAERDGHQSGQDENCGRAGTRSALADEEEEDGGKPGVERGLLDHHGAARQETGQDQPWQLSAPEVGDERKQRKHRRQGREQLAGEREGLDERGGTERRQEQSGGHPFYAPAEPRREGDRGEHDSDGHKGRKHSHRYRRAAAGSEQRPEDKDQPLRPIDPGAAVEVRAPLPESSNLGVPSLVRGQRRAPERDARGEREQGRRADGERWGPPRQALDRRDALLAGLVLALSLTVAVLLVGLSLTPDRYLFVLLVPALALRRGRRYLLDFVPFAALVLAYAESRGIAHLLHPQPHYLPQLHLEKLIFGGRVPTVGLQDWLWSGSRRWYDTLLLYVAHIHAIVPTTFAFILWLRRGALFYRFAATMLSLSYAAALTFWLYPAAPPWAAARDGLVSLTKIGGEHPATSSAGTSGRSLHGLIQGNPYAAIPSLHAGYAFLIFLFATTLAWRTPWRWWIVLPAALYAGVQSFAAVYTGNHYVVDVLIGFGYAAAALWAVSWLWRRMSWSS
jgi:membrane-associated phospholipid phosphatase